MKDVNMIVLQAGLSVKENGCFGRLGQTRDRIQSRVLALVDTFDLSGHWTFQHLLIGVHVIAVCVLV